MNKLIAYRLISIATGIIITIAVSVIFPQAVWAVSITDRLGVNEGYLFPCSSSSCVVSQNTDASHFIPPIAYHTDFATARETLLKVLSVVPRTQVIENRSDYIHAQSNSRIPSFVDDVEFYFPSDEKVIHLRSASRNGNFDLGLNRRRLEQIRFALRDLNI